MQANITNNDGLLVLTGTNNCLGYLMDFKAHGIFEPSLGKVDVAVEDAKKHNEVLSSMEIKGLDENCQVGQHGSFYYEKDKGVHTFIGTVVSTDVRIAGKRITFKRNGKEYQGSLKRGESCFNFKRIK